MEDGTVRRWPPDPSRFAIMRTDPDDQPPEHDPAKPWLVVHPTGIESNWRTMRRFADHGDALAYVTARPEYRRRTRKAQP